MIMRWTHQTITQLMTQHLDSSVLGPWDQSVPASRGILEYVYYSRTVWSVHYIVNTCLNPETLLRAGCAA